MRVLVLAAVVAFGSLIIPPAPPAAADGGFRCGTGRLVRDGETEDDVARKCGDPDAVRTWTESQKESVWQNGHKVEREVVIVYDEWKYDLGRDRLIRYVTFVQGRLSRVHTGSYGQ
jgi:hypothetical protein